MEEARIQTLGLIVSDYRPINFFCVCFLFAFSVVHKLPLQAHWGFSYNTLVTTGGGRNGNRAQSRAGSWACDKPEQNYLIPELPHSSSGNELLPNKRLPTALMPRPQTKPDSLHVRVITN